ncbi:hypothetical protein BGZ93_010820 [Podila epicladia]|nr:hypothetical protein BGZ93_010820 [Podila epicladia]
MNALIALAVWCQPHGPVTILTTQHRRPVSSSSCNSSTSSTSSYSPNQSQSNGNGATKLSTSTSTSTSTSATSLSPPHGTTSPSSSSLDDPINSQAQTLDQQKKSRRSPPQHSPGGGGGGGGGSCSSPISSRPSSTSNSGPCECQFSVPSGEKSLHSVDPTNSELSYISQPAPVDSSLFAPIRIACIRSLNAETYSGREGAVFFGDGVNGYVLSYMFTVYDAQSRGHRVKYTIMTMMTDRVYLVASMEYLISQFQVIASNLQSMANALYVPQQSPAARSMSYSSSHHRGSIMPENMPTKKGRPLTEVLAKPDIFVQLHAAFVSVLSNCGQRLTERHVQGRPMNDWYPFAAEDVEVALIETGDQEGPTTVDSLRELRRVLGPQKFNCLIWNSLVGNQVIIRGEEPRIVVEIVRSLEDQAPIYQADWSSTLSGAPNGLASAMEKMALEEESHNGPHSRPSIPGLLYSAGGGFQCQRRIYLLQAGEEPPDVLVDEKDQTRNRSTSLYYPLYIETINEILDLKLPKSIETKRLAVLREEWISKAKQFHNLYKAGCASDESVLNRFLVSMKVNRQDLKILRFFTRCARVTSHTQKYSVQASA